MSTHSGKKKFNPSGGGNDVDSAAAFVDCDIEVCPSDAVCPADITADMAATLFKEFGGSLGDDDDDDDVLTYKTYLTYDARLNPIDELDADGSRGQEAIVVYNHHRRSKGSDIENRSIHIDTTTSTDGQDVSTLSSTSRTTATPFSTTSRTVPRSNRYNNNKNKQKRSNSERIDNNDDYDGPQKTHRNNNDSSTTSEEHDSSSSAASSSSTSQFYDDDDSKQNIVVGSSSKSSSTNDNKTTTITRSNKRRISMIFCCCFILMIVLILIIVFAVTKGQNKSNKNEISDPLSTPIEEDHVAKSSTSSSSFDEYDGEGDTTSSSTVSPETMDPTTVAPTTSTTTTSNNDTMSIDDPTATNITNSTSDGTNEGEEEGDDEEAESSSTCQDAIIPNTRCYPAGNQDRPIRVFFINCEPQQDDWIGIFGSDTPNNELTPEDALDWMWTCGGKEDCIESKETNLVTFSSNSTNQEGIYKLHMIRRNSIYNGGNNPNNNFYSSYASSTAFEIKVNTRDCIVN